MALADFSGLISDLFTDNDFPPEQSSLTYVYSGDDKYERMEFIRAKNQCPNPKFVGVGGYLKIHLEKKFWHDRRWLRFPLAVISLNTRLMERIIPGLKDFIRNFTNNYTGITTKRTVNHRVCQ
ncbi:unnamed protein product [Dimorphilus gyrociliatus]|uniref:Calpain catalytic domain-containing protein n=1 Tax=Dimorphilus gyrociliatus TaxID=2664684 RepID=A0A7I8VGH5_9ANNE|nr:unnamed protein product [Dimorphilus gyrociliatus]